MQAQILQIYYQKISSDNNTGIQKATHDWINHAQIAIQKPLNNQSVFRERILSFAAKRPSCARLSTLWLSEKGILQCHRTAYWSTYLITYKERRVLLDSGAYELYSKLTKEKKQSSEIGIWGPRHKKGLFGGLSVQCGLKNVLSSTCYSVI